MEWIDSVFRTTTSEMKGLNWGKLYDTYHRTRYNLDKLNSRVEELLADVSVTKKSGIYEYVLGGETNPSLLNIRYFEDSVVRAAYSLQTKLAREAGHSNCPICATLDGKNKTKIYTIKEMEADHITAWVNGGTSTADNCQMLCKTHNRMKSDS